MVLVPNCAMLCSDILARFLPLRPIRCVQSFLTRSVWCLRSAQLFYFPLKHHHVYKASSCCPFVNRPIVLDFLNSSSRWQHWGEPLQVCLCYNFGACLTKGSHYKSSVLTAWPASHLKSPQAQRCRTTAPVHSCNLCCSFDPASATIQDSSHYPTHKASSTSTSHTCPTTSHTCSTTSTSTCCRTYA